jgi:hypothetical protein
VVVVGSCLAAAAAAAAATAAICELTCGVQNWAVEHCHRSIHRHILKGSSGSCEGWRTTGTRS